jgi:hypothetical protein
MNGEVVRPREFQNGQTTPVQLPWLLEQGRKISFINFTTLKEIRNCPKNEDVTEGRKCTKQQNKRKELMYKRQIRKLRVAEGMSEQGGCDV